MNNATDMVNLIRELIRDELAETDQTAVCKIISVNADGTVNIAIVPDYINTFSNINNETDHVFQPGDYAIVYKIRNKINNAFIIAAINPAVIDRRTAVAKSHEAQQD